ncbi:MAG: YceI family protein [Bacteroidota bacterium]|nr:YceI family protein [Bacteroidota bacterium]
MILKFFLPCLFFISTALNAQDYKPSDSGSKVHFVIKNFGINTGGDFTGLKGEITFLPDDISKCKFDITVSSSMVDTDNSSRDNHLRTDEYFDVQKYPEIKISSTKIDKTNKTSTGFYYFTGNITMHGITKPISFAFHAEKTRDDYLFTGNFEIERIDFGVGDKSSVLGNKVIVTLSVLAKKN